MWLLSHILGHDDEAEILEITAEKGMEGENNSEPTKNGQEQNQSYSV